jgi:hypothetical protein
MNFVIGQTVSKKEFVLTQYNQRELTQLRGRYRTEWARGRSEALKFAKANKIPLRTEYPDGSFSELVKIDQAGVPVFFRSYNLKAAQSTRTNFLNTNNFLPKNLTGKDMLIGVWDGGHPLLTHQEFQNISGRLSLGDATVPDVNFHATHVVGTIGASGVNPNLKGMATEATIRAFDWTSDVSEAVNLIQTEGLLLSNHSYGWDSKWLSDNNYSYLFGAYMFDSKHWDQLMYAAPYYLMVVSAGNDGQTNYNKLPLNPSFPQFDKLSGMATAKNNLVVAASQNAVINASGNLVSVNMASFSSQGPTDDLRIKPDIAGMGVSVLSTGELSDTDFFQLSGTSMAAPNVSGSLLLIQEHAGNVLGNYLKAATLKGLVLHTADDIAGVGPDAISGWGLLNSKRAAELINENNLSSRIIETTINQGQVLTFPVRATGNEPLKVSISWTDKEGLENYNLNSSNPVLIHDLDLLVANASNNFYPWRLVAVNQNARNAANNVDPFERVDIDNPSGNYTITVSHKGVLSSSQNFTLIVSGVNPEDVVPPIVKVKNVELVLNNEGNANLSASDVDDGTIDDVELLEISISKTSFGCENLGINTVIFKAIDSSGNESTAEVLVTVTDTISPVLNTRASVTLNLNSSGTANLSIEDLDLGSTDNCGIEEWILSKTSFDCSDIGDQKVAYLVRDSAGNQSTAEILVTVTDTISPVLNTRASVTLNLNSSGTANLSIEDLDLGSTDNCGIEEWILSKTSFDCSDIGDQKVTYVVRDTSGNESTAEILVTVTDTISPVLNTRAAVTLNLNSSGPANLTIEDIDLGSTDSCGIVERLLSKTSFDCSDIGDQQVTYVVRDSSGNESTAEILVTVTDTISPVLNTKATVTLNLNSSGTANLSIEDLDLGSTDNCGVEERILSKTSFDCSDIGDQQVTYVVRDTSGNESTAEILVTVADTISPVLNTRATVTLNLNSSGTANLSIEDIDLGSTDNCGIEEWILSKTSFDCSDIGDQKVTYVVRDSSGNESTAEILVTVTDTISPVLNTKATVTLNLNSSGTANLSIEDLDLGSTDNCGVEERILSKTSFDCSDIGDQQVTYVVRDTSGNESTAEILVTVTDTISPVLNTKATVTLNLNSSGTANLSIEDIDLGSTDNCGVEEKILSKTSFDCSDIGDQQVTYVVRDTSGNESTAEILVTVTDTISPVLNTRAAVTLILNSSGTANLSFEDIDLGSTGNCGIEEWILSKTSFDCSDIGDQKVTYVVRDSSGNESTAEILVTVTDTISPVLNTRATVTLNLNSSGTANLSIEDLDLGSTDNCGIEEWILSKTSFDCSDIGDQKVTYVVRDSSGNESTAEILVTVTDTISPVLNTRASVTLNLNSSGTANLSIEDLDLGSTDNCGIEEWILSKTSFDCSDIGDQKVTYVVRDTSGNESTAEILVTVTDTISPVLNTKAAVTLNLNSSGTANLSIEDLDLGSTDNCGIEEWILSKTSFDCSDIGDQKVTYVVRDSSGNESTAEILVTVTDTISPVLNTRASVTLNLNSSGTANLSIEDLDLGSTDNCGIEEWILSKTSFDCSDIGDQKVTYVVRDSSGNESTAEILVTVTDTISPVLNTRASVTLNLNSSGLANLSIEDIDLGSTDNCGIEERILSKTSFDCSDIGDQKVTYVVRDLAGNESTAEILVTVTDTISPVLNTRAAVTLILNSSGTANLSIEDIDLGSTGNCGIEEWILSKTSFDCSDIGDQQVTYVVRDTSGNESTAEILVTVTDTISPVLNTRAAVTLILNSSGPANLTIEDIDLGSTDSCGIVERLLSKTSFDCSDIGDQKVTYVVRDLAGNESTAEILVTVTDTISPVLNTKAAVTLILNSSGPANLTIEDIDLGSTDSCGIVERLLSKTSFDCSDIGDQKVTYVVRDSSGNESTAEILVTVTDTISPVLNTKATVTLNLNSSGTANLSIEDIDLGSTGNCGIEEWILSKTSFDCSDIGDQKVTYVVRDSSGNESTAEILVTVTDTISPVLNTRASVTLNLNSSGTANLSIEDLDLGSTDNCGIEEWILSKTSFDCSDIGDQKVTYVVRDLAGNESTAEILVTVTDTISPVLNTKAAVTLILNSSGPANLTIEDIDLGSTDSCGIVERLLSKTSFDCSDIGDQQVTYVVRDTSGNESTAEILVTVTDTISPVLNTRATVTLNLNSSGLANLSIEDIDLGSTDNCGVEEKILNKTSFDCSDIGDQQVTYVVRDLAGNESTAEILVTVTDTISPVLNTKAAVTLNLNLNGTAILTIEDIDLGSTDNCGVLERILSKTSFDCSDIGDQKVTYVVRDTSGNESTMEVSVRVQDKIAPIIMAKQVITLNLDATGNAILTIEDIDLGSTDNCGIVERLLSKRAFDCSNIGDQKVIYKVRDLSRNESSVEISVRVQDKIAPIIMSKQAITLNLDATGNAILKVEDIDLGSRDNCGFQERLLSKRSFDCSDIGDQKVIYKVRDLSRNESSMEVSVRVQDKIAPIIMAKQAITLNLDATGNAILTIEDIDLGSSDNCVIVERSFDKTLFTCSDIGDHKVIYTVKDSSGNLSSIEILVSITDNLPPFINAKKEVELKLDTNGFAELKVQDVDDGTYDNCKIFTKGLSQMFFTRSNLGLNTVTYTVIDANGNLDKIDINVNVIDFRISSSFQELKTNVIAFPNPAKEFFTLTFEEGIIFDTINCQVLDVTGKVQTGLSDFVVEGNDLIFDIKSLKPGLYFLKVFDENYFIIRRFVVEK